MTHRVLDRITASYAQRPVLSGVSCDAQGGQLVDVFGPNGAGKSTLLKALLGLIDIDGGVAQLDGRSLRCDDCAYMPQRSELDWDYPAVVSQVVEMGALRPLRSARFWLRRPRDTRTRVEAALNRVGMTSFAERQIGELSGGQQQRVLLARTLVREQAVVLLLDEPFAAVDALTERLLWSELERQTRSGKTAIVVHHDLSRAERFHRVLLLAQHRCFFGTPAEVLTSANLIAAYGGDPRCISPAPQSDARRAADRAAA